jgi:hypothetical protein
MAKNENSKKASKKTAVKATARKVAKKSAKKAARKSEAKAAAAPPPFDIVAKIACLNYLERVERGLPGDEQGDWLAAVQSLQGERSPQLT